MIKEKLKVFGIELDPWDTEGGIQIWRAGPVEPDENKLAKVSLLIGANGNWIVLFWDELKPLRSFLNRLEGNLTKEEAMMKVDEFMVRMDKLGAFQ